MSDDPAERRAFPRIQIAAPIEVQGASGSQASEAVGLLAGSGLTILRGATLIDLSRGGARFRVTEMVGDVGDRVHLFLPSLRGGEVGIMAEVVRCEAAGGEWHVAAQFSANAQVPLEQLYEMLDVLLSSADGGQRDRPRVAHRMLIRYGDGRQANGLLEDISASGLRMTTVDSFFAGDLLSVTLPDSRGEDLLTLRAKVLNQRPLDDTDPPRYQIGLAFTDLSLERRKCLEALVECILAR